MPRKASKQKHKTLSRQALLGQKGINLIEKLILRMGSRWSVAGPMEVGLDGYIELFDPSTGSPLGTTLAVQSKAVSVLEGDEGNSFQYRCERRDVDYWIQGNMPVVLIVSRPEGGEAYWVSVKDYFSDVSLKRSCTVRFDKLGQRFSEDSLGQLIRLGRPKDSGLYLAPLPRNEPLYSNLLAVEQLPAVIYRARTPFRKPFEVWSLLGRESGISGTWILRDGAVIGFEDFSGPAWNPVRFEGPVERIPTALWASSEDVDLNRNFVQLLNQCLRDQVGPQVKYWPDEDCYAFIGGADEREKKVPYDSLKRRSTITVVAKYKKTTSTSREFVWFRHLAFRGQFRPFDSTWYLEVTPTYRFTVDGHRLDRFHEERLSGIKRLEGNRAVLSAVLFWAEYLSAPRNLFSGRIRTLTLSKPVRFESTVGLDDKAWLKHDPSAPPVKTSAADHLLLPFLDQEAGS
jgi:uncharacterized protein DUF4365